MVDARHHGGSIINKRALLRATGKSSDISSAHQCTYVKELGKDLYSLAYYGYYIKDLRLLKDKAYLMLLENQNSLFFYKCLMLFLF